MIRPGVKGLFRLALRRPDVIRESVDDEITVHLAFRARELEAQGLPPDAAMREARRRFGDTPAARRALRAAAQHRENRMRFGEWVEAWWHDLRLTARQLRRARGFTAVAVLTLALGIGADTAIFTVFHRLLLDPLPFPDGNRIVQLMETYGGGHILVPPAMDLVDAWEARAHALHDLAVARESAYRVAESASQDSLNGVAVTPHFMRMLNVRPALGRDFLAADARPGAPAVAVIGYGFWQTAFGRRRDVLGTSIHVNGRAYTIVGVAPRGMAVPMSQGPTPSLWLPLPHDSMFGGLDEVFARLAGGATADQASREMRAIMAALPNAARYAHAGGRAMRAQDLLGGRESDTVKILFVAVGVLLLIACANVANLLLARGWSRRREFAVRVALGAGRARLVRQILAESVAVACLGGALALLVAWEGLALVIGMRPSSLTELAAVHMDPTVLVWGAGLSLAVGLLAGLAPALFVAEHPLVIELRSDARSGSGGVNARRVRSVLVVTEVALSLLLLVGAGLLVRSFVALEHTPLGFDPGGLIWASVATPSTAPQRQASSALRDISDRLSGTAGITGAATGSFPGSGFVAGGAFEADAPGGPRSTDVHVAGGSFASPGYFRVARIMLLAGRTFVDADASAAHNVVINRALARRLWPADGAVGKRFRFSEHGPWFTVLGVVADVHVPGSTGDASDLQIYQMGGGNEPPGGILLRTTASATDAEAVLRRAVASEDASLKVLRIEDGDDFVRRALAPQRFTMVLIGSFALVALVLAAVGLYGVVAYAVSRRTREIGVRIALGASSASVVRLVVREGLHLTAVGAAVGVLGAAVSTRAMRSMLYGVGPLDPWTFAGVVLLLVATTAVAAYVPVRRALRIDPVQALQAE